MSDEPQPRERPKSGVVKWAEREAEQAQRNADRMQVQIGAQPWYAFDARYYLRCERDRYLLRVGTYTQLAIKYGADFDRTDT